MPEKKVRRRPFGKRKGPQGPTSGRRQAKSVPEREKHTPVGMAQNRPEADGSQEWLPRKQEETWKCPGNVNGSLK